MPRQATGGLISLGRAIRHRRHELELSQEQLAQEAGLDRSYVGGVERGERNVAYLNIRRIALALKLHASELVARAERKQS